MKPTRAKLARRGGLILAVLAALAGWAPGAGLRPAQAATPTWHDTGITLPTDNADCFDAGQPGVLLVSNTGASSLGPPGTYTLDLATKQAARFSALTYDECNEQTGLLYHRDSNTGQATLFSRQDPAGRPIAHMPNYLAADGSLLVYALQAVQSETDTVHLWASPDGGLTWQQRPALPGVGIDGFAMSGGDPHALLAVTQAFDRPRNALTFAIYYSDDAGVTWEQRYHSTTAASGFSYVTADFLAGPIAPVTTVELRISNGIPGSNEALADYLSTDGARSFAPVGDESIESTTQLWQTPDGLLRLQAPRGQDYTLARSADGGRTWEARTLPFVPRRPPGGADMVQAAAAPANFFLGSYDGSGDLWWSPDSGRTWQTLGTHRYGIDSSPYVPLLVLGASATGALSTLDLPDASRSLPAPIAATGAPDSRFFPETGHTLAGPIRAYWEAQGGLAQFGYPRTEAVREVSPTDGRLYQVQYFERNRLEYHPEHAGTPYVVLLGLLGVQLTAAYRAESHGAFNRFADAHYPHGTYFPTTGHNLRNSFLDYWQAHGGLAIHGYPISEEFDEQSPVDGHTYVVQYFERSRFEYHPEHAGTPYAVLLGLLGNRLLEMQGWGGTQGSGVGGQGSGLVRQ